ncbi:hypothetical protein CENSYa_0503 [Cenarchaeum symbiosum A]|uniref:Uncharacterized protein n=1 Tax=Cenarchaeum symbiosum (strain A) TaxID=414004 RepID=A0RUW9_CENSY|nr:hypothetical protein CENSYa_0503 [Cenarchaeum symbiosum A]
MLGGEIRDEMRHGINEISDHSDDFAAAGPVGIFSLLMALADMLLGAAGLLLMLFRR